MNASVLATKVLVKEIPKEEKKRSSGLIIPENAGREPNVKGTVVLVGEGTPTVTIPVKEGNTVLFSPHSFQRVVFEDENYMLLDCRDILLYW
jgi:co-chaperonin GroES (HSP10)